MNIYARGCNTVACVLPMRVSGAHPRIKNEAFRGQRLV